MPPKFGGTRSVPSLGSIHLPRKKALEQEDTGRTLPMPIKPPCLESTRAGSTRSNSTTPSSAGESTTPSENLEQRLKRQRDERNFIYTAQVRARTQIQTTWNQELHTIITKFEKIRGPLSSINRKRTDDPNHINRDILHTRFKQAILENNWFSFNTIFTLAHDIGTATCYSPAYKNNKLLFVALQRAVAVEAVKEEIRSKFVTTLLSFPEVKEKLNKDKETYLRILEVLFRDEGAHITALRKIIRSATTNAEFQLLFKMAEMNRTEAKAREKIKADEAGFELLLNQQYQLSQFVMAEQLRKIDALLQGEKTERNNLNVTEQTSLAQFIQQWDQATTEITADALRNLSLVETKDRSAIIAAEQSQFAQLYQQWNQAIAASLKNLSLLEAQTREAIQTQTEHSLREIDLQEQIHACAAQGVLAINMLPSIETEQRNALLAEEQVLFEAINALHSFEEKNRQDLLRQEQEKILDILSQAKLAPVQTKHTTNQTKLHALGELCQDYLNYAQNALGCNPSEGNPETHFHDESKHGKLLKKYAFVKKLHDITQKTSSETSDPLKEFINVFNDPDHQTLLKTHRDNVFVQFIKSLWEIIKLIPKAFGYLSSQKKHPGFWQPAQGNVLVDALETELSEELRSYPG